MWRLLVVAMRRRWLLLASLLQLLLLLLPRLLVSVLVVFAVPLLHLRVEMSDTTLKVTHALHRLDPAIDRRAAGWRRKTIRRTAATASTGRRLRIIRRSGRWLRAVVRRLVGRWLHAG